MEECPEKLSDNARFCFEHGSQATAADYARAIRAVDEMKAKIDDLMDTYDLLLTPTMAVPPSPSASPGQNRWQDVPPRSSYSPMTRPFNLSDSPPPAFPAASPARGYPSAYTSSARGRRSDGPPRLRRLRTSQTLGALAAGYRMNWD